MMKKLIVGMLVALLAWGCASQFMEQRNLSRPMVALAMGKIQEEDIQGALVELRKALAANPTDPEVHYAYAMAYWKSGKYDRAIEHADKAIEYADKLELERPGMKSEALNLKGSVLVSQAQYDLALAYFRKALEDEVYQTPEFTLYNMASVYLQKKNLSLAKENAQKALDRNSHYAPAWHLLSKVFVAEGRPGDAVEALRHAVLEFPGYVEARYDLGQLYLQMGAREKAREQFEEVAKLDPNGMYGVQATARLRELTK